MKFGQEPFFYHVNCKERDIAGIVKRAYTDHTQFDTRNPHYDASSTQENPNGVWWMCSLYGCWCSNVTCPWQSWSTYIRNTSHVMAVCKTWRSLPEHGCCTNSPSHKERVWLWLEPGRQEDLAEITILCTEMMQEKPIYTCFTLVLILYIHLLLDVCMVVTMIKMFSKKKKK